MIDDDLLALLCTEREKYQRVVAGVADGAEVDLSLIRLPDNALMFPSPAGERFDMAQPRDPHAITRGFVKRAGKLGFAGLRFHDLRGSHGSNMLRRNVPVDVVARRLGHDPVTMWRSYIKPLPQEDHPRGTGGHGASRNCEAANDSRTKGRENRPNKGPGGYFVPASNRENPWFGGRSGGTKQTLLDQVHKQKRGN